MAVYGLASNNTLYCATWCMACGVWHVACGVRCAVCGARCVVCGVWCVVRVSCVRVRSVKCGVCDVGGVGGVWCGVGCEM